MFADHDEEQARNAGAALDGDTALAKLCQAAARGKCTDSTHGLYISAFNDSFLSCMQILVQKKKGRMVHDHSGPSTKVKCVVLRVNHPCPPPRPHT
jgi:hypothetical protein